MKSIFGLLIIIIGFSSCNHGESTEFKRAQVLHSNFLKAIEAAKESNHKFVASSGLTKVDLGTTQLFSSYYLYTSVIGSKYMMSNSLALFLGFDHDNTTDSSCFIIATVATATSGTFPTIQQVPNSYYLQDYTGICPRQCDIAAVNPPNQITDFTTISPKIGRFASSMQSYICTIVVNQSIINNIYKYYSPNVPYKINLLLGLESGALTISYVAYQYNADSTPYVLTDTAPMIYNTCN